MCNKNVASFSCLCWFPLFLGGGKEESCDVKDWYFIGCEVVVIFRGRGRRAEERLLERRYEWMESAVPLMYRCVLGLCHVLGDFSGSGQALKCLTLWICCLERFDEAHVKLNIGE
jgi:hypothetical protein